MESFNKQIKKYIKRIEQFPNEEASERFLVSQFEKYNQCFAVRCPTSFDQIRAELVYKKKDFIIYTKSLTFPYIMGFSKINTEIARSSSILISLNRCNNLDPTISSKPSGIFSLYNSCIIIVRAL